MFVWNPFRGAIRPSQDQLPNVIEAGKEPISGQFVGHTESSIVERFGLPSTRYRGHYGLPGVLAESKYPDAVTVTYKRPSGVLYLSYCWQWGTWVCFCSDWMPEGWAF
jgi:hypothetical protein